MSTSLGGKRILLTQASEFMGPVLREVLADQGAEVYASDDPLQEPGAIERLVAGVGAIDVLVANLSIKAPATPVPDVQDDEWRAVFAALVDPLPGLIRAVTPAMIARRSGKVLAIYCLGQVVDSLRSVFLGTEICPNGDKLWHS